MSLHYHYTLITPFEVAALHNLIARAENTEDRQVGYRWLCQIRSSLYTEWAALPDGQHLKEAYREDVWTWDDQDLASVPADRRVSSEAVRSIGEDILLDD